MGQATTELRPTGIRWTDGLVPALAGWVAARIAVALGFLVAHLLSGSVNLPYGRLHLDVGLIAWDGSFYRVITEYWYSGTGTSEDPSRFFPGYPALARAVSPLVGGNTELALIIISNAAALLAAMLVFRLAMVAGLGRRTADRSAWMVALIPAANVMVFAYTESLMLAAVTGALIALRRGRPGWAAACGLFASFLRPTGILLAVPAAIEMWSWYRNRPSSGWRPVATWGAAVAAPVVGLIGALWTVSRNSGDLLETYRIQSSNRQGFRDPVTRIGEAFVDFAQGQLHDVYNVAFAIGFLVLFVIAVRHKQPPSWIALMAVTWIVGVGGNNMDSVGRYCLVAAPFAIALAQWAQKKWQQVAVAAVGVVGTVWFTTEVLLGRIIP